MRRCCLDLSTRAESPCCRSAQKLEKHPNVLGVDSFGTASRGHNLAISTNGVTPKGGASELLTAVCANLAGEICEELSLSLQSVEGEGVQELPAPEQALINGAQCRVVDEILPMLANGLDLLLGDGDRFRFAQMEMTGGGEAGSDLAGADLIMDQHGLACFATGARLWANVIGRGQG